MSEPFIGEVRLVGFNFAPRNWAMCNGQTLSIEQNDALYSLLGTMYGGDGRSTFGLPDLRGRAPIHQGAGPGLTNRRIASYSGIETYQLSFMEMPSHSHGVTMKQLTYNSYTPGNVETGETSSPNEDNSSVLGAANTSASRLFNLYNTKPPTCELLSEQNHVNGTATVQNSGGSGSHSNLQPYLTLTYCIALYGIYPSRH